MSYRASNFEATGSATPTSQWAHVGTHVVEGADKDDVEPTFELDSSTDLAYRVTVKWVHPGAANYDAMPRVKIGGTWQDVTFSTKQHLRGIATTVTSDSTNLWLARFVAGAPTDDIWFQYALQYAKDGDASDHRYWTFRSLGAPSAGGNELLWGRAYSSNPNQNQTIQGLGLANNGANAAKYSAGTTLIVERMVA
jgi:hypothetical protein